ncbi:MAG TPA: Tim44-like domain-containing protein, partial [Burkholderiaceae bacterium]|nr:Tim44-like domain-containing protein [Burkholderiaceae bacterium]
GLAALMSHLGLGAEFGNIIMLALLGFVAFIAIRLLMNRFGRSAAPAAMATPGGLQFAGAPPPTGNASSALAPPAAPLAQAAAGAASSLPAGFDAAAFERIAKMIFIRMQTANDSADLNDLRAFTTPEMFAAVKLELQERAGAAQATDVVRIDAEVLDVTSEPQRQLVSVRFHGLIREEHDGAAAPFDEVWHLVKPADGSREWAIAGIQQSQAA